MYGLSSTLFDIRPLNLCQANLRMTLLAGVAAAGLGFAPALAQTETAPEEPVVEEDEDAGEDDDMELMVVTARRREESLQDVPISITAFDGDALVRTAVQDITFLSQTVPNVTIEVSRGTNTTVTAFIRGVGQQDPVAGFEQGVGIYIDDVYLNRPQAAILDVYDVERIEVLRGPQGTLYGRNTIGGAIKYVTKRLSTEREFDLRLTAGSFEQFDAVFKASIPITDELRVGGTIARFTRDGFGDNLTLPGIENYQRDIVAARASVEWEPGDGWFFRVAGDVLDDDSDPRQGFRETVGNLSGAPILDNVFDTRAGLNNPLQEVKGYGISVLTEWEANENFTFKNIFAYREDRTLSPIDFDSLPSADLDVPVIYDNQQLSNEFQILYSSDILSGVLGVYYLRANAFNAFDVILDNLVPGFNSFTLGDVDTDTWSVFGDYSVDLLELFGFGPAPLMEGLELSFGGRYTSDKRTAFVLRQNLLGGTSEFFGGDPIVLATTSDFLGSDTFTDFSPRVSLAWRPNADHNFYVTYSEGFKGGGFDPRGLTSAAPDIDGDGIVEPEEEFQFIQFQPEEVDSLEFGVKSAWFGGRVNTSLAVFLTDYTDVQIPGSFGLDTDGDGLDDQFIGVTTNAAEATVNGVEFEGFAVLAQDAFTPGDDVSLAWTFGYIDAEFDTFIDAAGNDVADERFFQNTPEYSASGTFTYETPMTLFTAEGTLSFVNIVSYRSFATQFEFEVPLLDQPGFLLYDASLVWESENGTWQLGLHGKNLTDEEYRVAGYNFPTLGLEGSVTSFYGNPRQILGTVQVRF